MARKLLVIVLALAGCSKGAEADLPYIGAARSLAAEWALVNEQANAGNLTDAYVMTMRSDLRDQLTASSKSLSNPRSAYGQDIAALLNESADAPPAKLRAHAMRLKKVEDSLESD